MRPAIYKKFIQCTSATNKGERRPAIYKDVWVQAGDHGSGATRMPVASDEELNLKERLKRQPSRAGRKGPKGKWENEL
jgi:hypothetical protein